MVLMPNYNIEAIWKRLRRKIDLSKVKGATPKQWKKDFIKQLKSLNGRTKNLDKIGKKGFFYKANKKNLFPKQSVYLPRYDGKTAVLDKKGKTRLIKTENIKITESTYKGQKAVYIFNKRTKKRATMSLLKGD
jgi:hypothetical protein